MSQPEDVGAKRESDRLTAWSAALAEAEADLRAREQLAAQEDPTPQELAAFAAERDKLSDDRDALADAYDARARLRDLDALDRDVAGSDRDRTARRIANDLDDAALDRFAAGEDRDYAAGDRGDSYDDRARSSQARHAAADDRRRASQDRQAALDEVATLHDALHTRLQIGQAQGLLMARHALNPDQAFALLVRMSQSTNVKLRDAAAQLVLQATQDAEEATLSGRAVRAARGHVSPAERSPHRCS